MTPGKKTNKTRNSIMQLPHTWPDASMLAAVWSGLAELNAFFVEICIMWWEEEMPLKTTERIAGDSIAAM